MNEETYNDKPALPNKLLQKDGSITDLVGNPVTNATDVYNSKRALPNKWLNPDGTYSTLEEILAGSIGTDLFIVVEELPATGEPNKIYLLVDGDKLIEYHWTGTKWDPMGMVEFDISKYSTTEQMNTAIAAALNSAKTYAEGQAFAAETNAKAYTDDKFDEAASYAEQEAYLAEESAKAHANGVADTAENNAKEYARNFAETKKSEAITSANSYTDTAIRTSITQVLGGSY